DRRYIAAAEERADRHIEGGVDRRVDKVGRGVDESGEAVRRELRHFEDSPRQRRDPHDPRGVVVDVDDPYPLVIRVDQDRPVILVVLHPVRTPLADVAVPDPLAGQPGINLRACAGVDTEWALDTEVKADRAGERVNVLLRSWIRFYRSLFGVRGEPDIRVRLLQGLRFRRNADVRV